MEIKHYTTGTILEFVSSGSYLRLKDIPISKQRAISYAHNPRAASSDKILWVAFENDEVAGYVGTLPDKIYSDGEWKRMGWLSCFWVDPRFRGKNVSKQLFECVIEEWNNTVLITNMQPGTLRIYERTGYYHSPVSKAGIRGYLRFNLAEILPPKGRFFPAIKPILRSVDFIFNLANAIRLVFYPGYKTDPSIQFEYVEEIGREAEELINKCNQQYLNRRGKEELEWITKYPWVLEEEENTDSRRYYFSSVSKRFFYQKVEFRNETGTVTAYLMLSIRNNHLTVPYAFFKEGMESTLVKFLYNTMLDYQLNMITVFHPGLSEEIKRSHSPFLFKKKILRPYFIPKTLGLPELAFQDGDGDCVFT
jgi:GNAT superfamily N-acetyltransferase